MIQMPSKIASLVASWVGLHCHLYCNILLILVGSTALVSLGGWTYYSGMQQLRLQRKAIEMSKSKYKYGSRQLGILTLSATFVSMGIYRMLN